MTIIPLSLYLSLHLREGGSEGGKDLINEKLADRTKEGDRM